MLQIEPVIETQISRKRSSVSNWRRSAIVLHRDFENIEIGKTANLVECTFTFLLFSFKWIEKGRKKETSESEKK